MRITLSTPRTGIAYFPGLARPQALDLEQVPAPVAREIEACLAELLREDGALVKQESSMRDDILHDVVVEAADGSVRHLSGPPVGAMKKLVRAFRHGLRSAGHASPP
jgi:hypothetical protein